MYVIRHIATNQYYLRKAFRNWSSKSTPHDFSPDLEKAHVYNNLRTARAFHTSVTKEYRYDPTLGRWTNNVIYPKTDFEIVEVELTVTKVVS